MNQWKARRITPAERFAELTSDLVNIASILEWLGQQVREEDSNVALVYELTRTYLSELLARGPLNVPQEDELIDCVIELESWSDPEVRKKRNTERPDSVRKRLEELRLQRVIE